MAALKKRRAKWYARVRWYNEYGKRQEKQIPLKTENESIAVQRMLIVEKKERHIKRGMEFQFPWQNEICELKVCHYILESAVKI